MTGAEAIAARLAEQNAAANSWSANPQKGWTAEQARSVAMGGPAPSSDNRYGGGYTTNSSVKQSSGGNSGKKSSKESAESKLKKQQEKLRKSMAGSFSGTIDAYSDMIGWLPDEQSNLEGQVNTLAETQKNSINDALNSALEKFGTYRSEVAGNQKDTLQDLSDNTRNLFAAGNNYLGARGAGNSSATGMYSAALTQQANKQRADIQSQTNKMYNDINMQESDVKAQSQQQIDAIETWKATRTTEIVQQYQDLKRQLTVAKAQANDSQKQALAQLDASLFNAAINKLNNIQSIAGEYKTNVSGVINEQTGRLQGQLDTINNKSKYQVQDQTFDMPQGIQQGQTQGNGDVLDQATGQIFRKDPTTGQWYQIN